MDIGIVVTAVNNATAGLTQVNDSVERLGRTSQATANRLKAIQVVIAGILFEKTLELGKAFIAASSAVQNVETRMSAWSGGALQASAIMQKLNKDLGASGVSLEGLSNAFIKLRASGLDNTQATRTLENLTNGIAAVGGGDLEGKLQSASTAFQLFISKGLAGGRELRTFLTSTGLTVAEVSEKMGVSVTEFYDKLRDRTLGSQQLLEAFNQAAEQKFGGFVTLLGSTVGGALNKFKSDFELALGGLGSNTTLNAQITAIIHNLDDAVVQFIKDIKPEDVNRFFEGLKNIAITAGNVAVMIWNIVTTLASLADMTSRFLNILPPEATEYGIIGYVLMGKKGALIGAVLGAFDKGMRDMGSSVDQFMVDNGIAPKFFAADKAKLGQGTLDALAQTIGAKASANGPKSPMENWVAKQFGTPKQIQDIIDGVKKIQAIKITSDKPTPLPGNTQIAGQIAALKTSTNNTLASISGKDALLAFQNAGDELGAKIQSIRDQTQQWIDSLNTAKTAVDKSKMSHADIANYDTLIAALQAKITADTQNAVTLATTLVNLKMEQFGIEQKIVQMHLQDTERQLTLTAKKGSSSNFAMASGTAGAQFFEQIAQQQAQLKETIATYSLDLSKVTGEMAQNAGNPGNLAALQTTAAEYQRVINLSQTALANLNAESALETQFWTDLGNVIANDVGDAISGLIQGTMTWADAGRKLFSDLTNLAMKYIEQLIEMQIYQNALSGGSMFSGGAGGGGLFGALISMMGFANGGAFQGQITPFANGGLTTGPTLFGLMGEAGTEAVMPLTRIGGKLGVHAAGGGGANHYHINISAIDTQSGLQFIGQNIAAIDAGLNQSSKMNTRAGKY